MRPSLRSLRAVLGTALCLLAMAQSPSSAPTPPKVLQDFSHAVTLLEQGETDDALREFQSCLRRSPTYAAAAKMVGACYVTLGDRKSALAAFRHALNLDPQNGELMLLLASFYREDAQYPVAEAFLRGAEKRLGATAAVQEEWILLTKASGQTEQLRERLVAQIEANPEDRRPREELIEMLRGTKEFAEAAEAARALAVAFPDDPNAPLRVAHLYLEGQLYPQAARELETLARRLPDPRQALRVLVDLYTTKMPDPERLEQSRKRLESLPAPRRGPGERR